jgi:hypothetical protein
MRCVDGECETVNGNFGGVCVCVCVCARVCACTHVSACVCKGHSSAVGMVTGYGLDDQEVRVQLPVGSRIFSSPYHPDRLWGLPNLLSNGYQGFFPRG